MTFTKAIFAASLAAVVIAAPAVPPGIEENDLKDAAGKIIEVFVAILAKIKLL
ncbi:hypothetical protein EDB84DRAFT_1567228 [Lactarius hengduanensis]|nr:hypothetical protein EDB84DRAFT_1567228 [Lactarius hengduanensis]